MVLVSSICLPSSTAAAAEHAAAEIKRTNHFFSKIPAVLLRPVMAFDGGSVLPQCDHFLARAFQGLYASHYKKLYEELALPPQIRGLKMPSSIVETRREINNIALMQIERMRLLFSRHELQQATGFPDSSCIPLSLRPSLPDEKLVAYLSHYHNLNELHLSRMDEISKRTPMLPPYDFVVKNWKIILLNGLQQKKIVFAELSLLPPPTPGDLSHAMVAGFSQNPALIRSVFRDIIDRLYSQTNSVGVFRLFMSNNDNVIALTVTDLKYAFFSIVIGELRAYELKLSIVKLAKEIELIFLQLRVKGANFDALKAQLHHMLSEIAIEFQSDCIPKIRFGTISPRLRNLEENIRHNIEDFIFPNEFIKWKNALLQWENAQNQVPSHCPIL